MVRNLAETLDRAGKPTATWNSPDGSTALVLPYGGRILGLFATGSERNFFWTHPALEAVDSARGLYQSSEWHNSGGDRTWLSPEIDFFLPNFPKLDTYFEPREFDPGNYQILREGGGVTLKNRFSVQHARSGQRVGLELTKSVMSARNPLRHVDSLSLRNLTYAGYTLRTRLQFVRPGMDPVPIGIWNLLQLPHGGELLIPTLAKSTPAVYLGHIDERDLTITDRLIRYKMRASGEHKVGIQAPSAIGRAGYFYSEGGRASLVIRNFSINPSGEYVDVPWTQTDCAGSTIQACNVSSKLGAFSELEYHVPAITGLEGDSCCEDESQLWAYHGPEQSILDAARLLVSSEV